MEITESYPYMNWENLKKNYPDSWILLFNPISKDIGLKAESGYLVFQDEEKTNVIQKSLDTSLWEDIDDVKSIGIFFKGSLELSENQAICLGL
jgi:hypothetical protein